jgi:hypothetical protein
MRKVVGSSLLVAATIVCGASILLAQRIPQPAQGSRKKIAPGGLIPPNAGNKLPPSPVETPTTLTFYENTDRTGVSYSVQINPPVQVQATLLVTTNTLASAGLAGKVSAARIQCGTRPSRASLFDVDWGQFSSGTMIECLPGQTTDVNLATITNPRALDDKINAAALVAHVRSSDGQPHSLPFSTFFDAEWKANLKAKLPSSATLKDTYIWLEDSQDVHIQQFLQLDSTWCTARTASFEIRIALSAANFRPLFNVYALSQNVDTGFGDLWGCHDHMVSDLQSGVNTIIASLNGQLPTLVPTDKSSSVFYFAPEGTTLDFDVFYWQ